MIRMTICSCVWRFFSTARFYRDLHICQIVATGPSWSRRSSLTPGWLFTRITAALDRADKASQTQATIAPIKFNSARGEARFYGSRRAAEDNPSCRLFISRDAGRRHYRMTRMFYTPLRASTTLAGRHRAVSTIVRRDIDSGNWFSHRYSTLARRRPDRQSRFIVIRRR